MELIRFNDSKVVRSNKPKSLKLILGVVILAGAVGIGSTLAASINLNSGGPVEFGQGVAQTIACDDEITITPYSTFINQEGGGEYYFSSLRVSGIDSSSDKCSGKTFEIKAYSDMGIVPLFTYEDSANSIDDDYNFVEISNDGGDFTWVSGGTDGDDVIPGPDNGITETSFTLSFTSDLGTITRTPLALAEDVTRITIESRDSTVDSDGAYSIGDTGPGGGKIFYFNEVSFLCGPTHEASCNYLEAAPSGWGGVGEQYKLWSIEESWNADVLTIENEVSENNLSAGIGLGYLNSIKIVSQGNDETTAAGASRAYNGGSLNDWYLPTTAELNQMCKWQRGLAWTSDATVCAGGTINTGRGASGFEDYLYWSSSESSANYSWLQDLDSGVQQNNWDKGYEMLTRPIRAF
jgi:hypothetical protein